MGRSLEEIEALIDATGRDERLGLCIDTQHLWASGVEDVYKRQVQVPEVLRSGDHARIARWRRAQALWRTLERRPDLIERRGGLSAADEAIMGEFPALEGPRRSG